MSALKEWDSIVGRSETQMYESDGSLVCLGPNGKFIGWLSKQDIAAANAECRRLLGHE